MKEKKTIQALTEIVDGKLLAIASDDSVDRMGDSLDINRWNLKNFKKNPVLLAGHQNSPEFVIGVAKNIRVEGNKLLFEPMFHGITEVARNIRDMFQEKVLTAWSVGFIPGALMNPDDKSVKNELLEVSAVAVPANANALTSAKAYGEDVKKEVKNWVDKSVEEKEETNETIAEELSDDEKMKKKYELFGEVDKIIWAFYKVYMNKDIEVEKFNSLLDETPGKVLIKSSIPPEIVGINVVSFGLIRVRFVFLIRLSLTSKLGKSVVEIERILFISFFVFSCKSTLNRNFLYPTHEIINETSLLAGIVSS